MHVGASSVPLPLPPGRDGLGQRIRALRRHQGLTQHELAGLARINQGYLSVIERGARMPGRRALQALARAIGVAESVLIGDGEGHDAPQPLETREAPLFGTIPNGPPGSTQEGGELFPVLRHLWSPDRYCLRCEFDSMEPTLKRGDIIVVEYRPDANPEFVQGRICVCLIEGQSTLKRVNVERRGGQRRVVLRGDNPDAPHTVIAAGVDFSIQGVAIALANRAL
jgi:transcriptional regulator with XRE-family HTH domain